MSNNKWQISEVLELKNQRKELFVYKSGGKQEAYAKENLRTLVETEDMRFSMIYMGGNSSKMLGYHFDFSSKMPSPIYINERTAVFMFDGKKNEPKINVIFEDQVIRLLSYEQVDKDKKGNEIARRPDYWLVGRWRY